MRKLFAVFIIIMLFPFPTLAQETVPGDTCTAGQTNLIRQTGGPETTGVIQLMRCNGTVWEQRATWLANGNVGIGTTSPQQKLHVYNADTGSTPTQDLRVEHAGSGSLGQGTSIGLWGSTVELSRLETVNDVASGSSLRFYTYNSGAGERMRITNTGNVGIGDTNPNAKLDVAGSIEYTGTIADLSDRRKKTNIHPLSGQLDNILRLQGVSFTMKDDPERTVELGLIAQDVEPLFPELVKASGDDGIRSMNYTGLIAPMIEAIKEQQAQIDRQQRQIDALLLYLDAPPIKDAPELILPRYND